MALKRNSKLDSLDRVQVHSREDWRAWLKKNHTRAEGIWLITFKKHVEDKYVDYDAIVEEALCYGWVDSRPRLLDADRRMLFIAPRKPKSVWSKLNKERVARLIKRGSMAAPGLKKIEEAKQDGSWSAIDHVEALTVPVDLAKALAKNKAAQEHFDAFPPSSRKIILLWVTSAKTERTRRKRIAATVELAAKNIRANHYRQ